ncbi:hypothetical protein CRG98_000527 [Punica granatum]|uniref:Uncharacterized protein n=1 Tax=Punica granatum TaxID=22663 RepID=A0A2I0LFQ0_PUNGR|nr:hypothetical protein CRG98_000527 [Punica granatum]
MQFPLITATSAPATAAPAFGRDHRGSSRLGRERGRERRRVEKLGIKLEWRRATVTSNRGGGYDSDSPATAIDGPDLPDAARGLEWPQPYRRDGGCDHRPKVDALTHDWVSSHLLSLPPEPKHRQEARPP